MAVFDFLLLNFSFYILPRSSVRIPGDSAASSLKHAHRQSTIFTMVYCTSFDSKIGLIYVASTDKGVCKVSVPRQTKKDFFRWLRENFDDSRGRR